MQIWKWFVSTFREIFETKKVPPLMREYPWKKFQKMINVEPRLLGSFEYLFKIFDTKNGNII